MLIDRGNRSLSGNIKVKKNLLDLSIRLLLNPRPPDYQTVNLTNTLPRVVSSHQLKTVVCCYCFQHTGSHAPHFIFLSNCVVKHAAGVSNSGILGKNRSDPTDHLVPRIWSIRLLSSRVGRCENRFDQRSRQVKSVAKSLRLLFQSLRRCNKIAIWLCRIGFSVNYVESVLWFLDRSCSF